MMHRSHLPKPKSPATGLLKSSFKGGILGAVMLGSALATSGSGQATPFTAGNLVVYRVGSGSASLTNNGSPVFLDEYTPTGALVRSLALPTTTTSSGNRRLVAAGMAPAEGGLSRSADGRFLIATGYDAASPSSTALPATTATAVARTLAKVANDGSVDTTRYLQDSGSDGGPLGAVSADGSSFWMSGSAGALRYLAAGSASSSIQLNSSSSGLRQPAIFHNQLYVSSAGSAFRIAGVGSGLPTTSGQTLTALAGLTGAGGPHAFFLADLSSSVSGPDTLYLADDVYGVQKFSLVGGSWVNNGATGSDAEDYRGLTATVSGNTVTLYATRKGGASAAGGGELVKLVDTGGYNGSFTGTPSLLATAATNTAFRGIALAPQPAPASLPDSPVTTLPATGLTSSAALLHGSANLTGYPTVYFEYGATTAYGNRTATQETGGALPASVADTLTDLTAGTTWHYRLVGGGGTNLAYGSDQTFTLPAAPPVAVTGTPVAISTTGATLVAAVNPNGLAAQVRFLYGLTPLYGSLTDWRGLSAGSRLVDVQQHLCGLTPGATYHYCVIATTAAGTRQGDDVSFLATGSNTDSDSDFDSPTAAPEVTTVGAAAVGRNAVELLGTVNPHDGTAVAWFQYGMTTAYGHTTAIQGLRGGASPLPVSLAAAGLLPGTLYHFRLAGANSHDGGTSGSVAGAVAGADLTFTTAAAPPTVVTGDATATSTTHATVAGTVRARGWDAQVFIDFGTNPAALSNSIAAAPATVTGEATTAVGAELTGLAQGTTYYYQVRASNAGGTALGELRTFDVGVLSGLLHGFPEPIAASARQGALTVALTPGGIGGGWRFEGEPAWRAPGSTATGLTAGGRVIEYRRVPGYQTLAAEAVEVASDGAVMTMERSYTAEGSSGSGSLSVTLLPATLADAQWRFSGESDTQWKSSEVTVSGLVAGDYVIECKPLANRSTPPPVIASVAAGANLLVTRNYEIAEDPAGVAPEVLTFAALAPQDGLPYAYVGQLTSDAGSSSGFVVRPRVVATAGHVVFDDNTLAASAGVRWHFQRQQGVHEPVAVTPRGYELLSGYAAQRAAENTPGSSSPQSQNLDAAALFFLADAGRGGYSGYFASDSSANEFLLSSAMKTLAGYPVDGIAPANQGSMHATPPANVAFASAYGQTYTTADIRGGGGNSGGPLCVRHASGVYYPAAIYLGGSAQMVVRAIDSTVLALFQAAEASAGSGVGVTHSASTLIGSANLGALQVDIEPAAARAAGAGWRLQGQSGDVAGGTRIADLTPGSHTVVMTTLSGFVTPAPVAVAIEGGRLTSLTFTYQANMAPPVVTSPEVVDGAHGQPLGYQISVGNSPLAFTVQGALPDGMVLHAASGLIDGTPLVAGIFPVTVGAVNAGGTGTRLVTFRCSPVVPPQSATVIVGQAVSYAILSSETGAGVVYTAVNLPQGLVLDGGAGVISGTTVATGNFPVAVTVTRNGAAATATLTLNVVNPLPVFTLQPVAYKEVPYGTPATLTALAEISLTEDTTLIYQWYAGASGNTSHPVSGALAPTFTTPPITLDTQYWVRATSASGTHADSTATTIVVLSSANANLADLTPSQGTLSPAFNPGIDSYTISVPYSASISLNPEVQVALSTVMVNGSSVAAGAFCAPVALTGATTTIDLSVTSGDQTTVKHYTITVARAAPPAVVTTGEPTAVAQVSATLHGSVVPNGTVNAYFQYLGPLDTAYRATPGQILTGTSATAVQATLSGLSDLGLYHYRLVVVSGADVFTGDDMTFTVSNGPLVATGTPIVAVTPGGSPPYQVTLVGAVNPLGLTTTVSFQFKDDLMTGYLTTQSQTVTGSSTVDFTASATSLINPAATRYFYRIVATNPAGTSEGDEVSFTVATANTGSGSGAPLAVTGSASDLAVSEVKLHGQINPNGKSSFAWFEYGTTTAYGSTTRRDNKGDGNSMINVTQEVEGLFPGTLYHYRCVAENGSATARGLDATFTTASLPPLATTGTAEALTATSVRVRASVRARGAATTVAFEYGTDGNTFPFASAAVESPVTGDLATPASAVLTGLSGATTYYYRVIASNAGGTVRGSAATLQANALLGYVQRFTPELAANDYQGQVRVNLQPSGGGWRFVGETRWRASGTTAAGLTTGNRQIEFQPLAGRIQPPAEMVGVVSGEPLLVLERFYFESAVVGDLRVILKPDTLAGASLPAASRGQWRMIGDVSGAWRNSGDAITGIWPGSYLVECKEVAGLATPAPVTVMVQAGMTARATLSYSAAGGNPAPLLDTLAGTAGVGNLSVRLLPAAVVANGAQWRLAGDERTGWRYPAEDLTGILPGNYLVECKDVSGRITPTPMKVTVVAEQTTVTTITYFTATAATANLQPVSLATASTSQDRPYGYVGMVRSGTGGGYSGFVVKQQVVATVAQAVFDEDTLSATTDLQWLLQSEKDQFDPVPQIPRGFHALSGYAAQRAAENTPGALTVVSENLNVAALYFNHNAGRGGFSGFLATTTAATAAANEFLESFSAKTLVGYPLRDILAADAGKMHGTTPVNSAFTLAYGQTYTSPSIQGVEGMLGGPLCVQYGGGSYYPAGIFVGGTTGSAVRAIDSETVSLFASAAASGNGGDNDTGGGITLSSFSTIGSPADPGAIKVTIEPAGARAAGAGWRLSPEVSYRSSGAQKSALSGGYYVLQLRTVSGYQAPAPQSVHVIGGQRLNVTFTYLEDYTPLELWRLANFGTTANSGDAADGADPDGDGSTNIAEYAAATDPNVPDYTALQLWRLANFGTTANSGDAADSADPDGDGSLNSSEYAAATGPNNSADVFRCLAATRGPTSFTVTAAGKATRSYVLQLGTTLDAGPWTDVDSVGPLGADGTVTLVDSAAPATSGFYRMQVTSP